ncbi:unnamed protein product, partial [Aphanomyces euteiches]
MVGHQPPSWRTDMIVFTDGNASLLSNSNCSTAHRKMIHDVDRCIIVDIYKFVKTTEFAYDFAGSINVAAVETPAMGLRVDIDTFLTPHGTHDGVFAGHLAIHDCTTSVGGFHKRDNIMDYPKFETDDVSLHAHVLYWESMDDFSKTKFVLGHNKRIDVETLDPARVNQFALQLALQANRVDFSA